MPLTPEQVAALGLPDATAAKRLSEDDARALGLPVAGASAGLAPIDSSGFHAERIGPFLKNLATGAAHGISSGGGPISKLVRESLIRPEETAALEQEYQRAKGAPGTGAGEFVGSIYTPENAIAGEFAGAGLGVLAKTIAPKLARGAERAAIRSAMPDRTVYRRVLGRPANPQKVSDTGRFLLNETRLRSPSTIQDDLASIIANEGPTIGGLPKAAGQAGAQVDLQGAALQALQNPKIAKLAKDTEGRPVYDRIMAFLDDQVAQQGNTVTPEAGHALRMRLDQLAKWDKTRPDDVNHAWRAVRDSVDDELGAAMDRAGMGDAWRTANKRYATARDAKDLADIGVERRSGNKLLQLGEWGAGIAGTAAAAAHNPAGAGAAASIILANRYGMPTIARTANWLSRAPLSTAATPTGQVIAKESSPLAEALWRRFALDPLVPVAAEQDPRNGVVR